MRFQFKSKKLNKLCDDGKGAKDYPKGVVTAFHEVIQMIDAAHDERDIRRDKSFHYEKLKEKKWEGCYSIRLNIQYRLIFEWLSDEEGRYLNIIKIDKHDYK